MGKRKEFDIKIKFEDRPIFNSKGKSLEELEDSLKTLKRKFK